MVEKSIESENARFFYRDLSERNNQMLVSINQFNYFTIVLLGGIWTIVSKYVIDDPTSLTVVGIALNISIGIILLWRFLVHQIDNDIAKNYPRMIFYEHALTGFESTPTEQSMFYNLTENFPRWKEIAAVSTWNEQYRAFNILSKKKKLGERGHQNLDKIAIWVSGFLLFLDFVIASILFQSYGLFDSSVYAEAPAIGYFFVCLWILKDIAIIVIAYTLFTINIQLNPDDNDVKKAFITPTEVEMATTLNNHGVWIAWILLGIGVIIWILGSIANISFLNNIGPALFFGGAAFVIASKTLIYQDHCNAELIEELINRLDRIEKKIEEREKNDLNRDGG